MTKRQLALIATTLAIVLALTGNGRCAEESEEVKAAKAAIKRFGGEVTDSYFDPFTQLADKTQKTVTFANNYLTDADLICLRDPLEKINPSKLDLRVTKVTGVFWPYLNLPRLVELDLSSTLVNSAGLQELRKLNRIVWSKREQPFRLRLNSNYLTLDSLKRFGDAFSGCGLGGNSPNTRGFILSISGITVMKNSGKATVGDILSALIELKGILTGVDLESTGATDIDLKILTEFKQLSKLGLANNKVSDLGLDLYIRNMIDLEALSLSGNKEVTNYGLGFLTRQTVKKLQVLVLAGTGHPEDDVIQQQLVIRYLVLNGVGGLFSINRWDAAISVALVDQFIHSQRTPGVTNQGLKALVDNIDGLVRLDISGTKTRLDWQVRARSFLLPTPFTLTRLNLSKTGVSDKELKIIGSIHSLQYLDLSDTVVTNNGMNSLKALVNLRSISLENTKCTSGAYNLLKALQAEEMIRSGGSGKVRPGLQLVPESGGIGRPKIHVLF